MLKPLRVYKSGSKIGSISTSEKKNNCTYTADANTKDIFNNLYIKGLSVAWTVRHMLSSLFAPFGSEDMCILCCLKN